MEVLGPELWVSGLGGSLRGPGVPSERRCDPQLASRGYTFLKWHNSVSQKGDKEECLKTPARNLYKNMD